MKLEITEEWCLNAAKREGNQEVSVGVPYKDRFIPCPICDMDEGCDHSFSERKRAAEGKNNA